MLGYLLERMRGYLVDKGYAADAIDAVMAKHVSRPLDIVARLDAIEKFRSSDAAASLASASKRMTNILKKVKTDVADHVTVDLLKEPAERALHDEVERVRPVIEDAMQQRNYALAMQETARLKPTVDAFFDDVMVMDEQRELRENRLALLRVVNTLCCGTAELGLLRPEDGKAEV